MEFSPNQLQIDFTLARFAEIKGKFERAIEGYQKILNAQPAHEPTLKILGELFLKLKSFESAAAHYRQATTIYPNNEIFQKGLITALVEENGIDAPFAYFQLSRIDSNELTLKPADILACVVVRNEVSRLPFFLNYYRQKKVDKFFIVDNTSADGTTEFLLQQPDVFLWQTSFSFNQSNFGSAWFEVLLRKYGIGHWVLTVDADEIFYYPNVENKNLPELCGELESRGERAYQAILLDMYSDQPLAQTRCLNGQNFLETCPYFDRQFYHRVFEDSGPQKNQTFYFGGMRERVFGQAGDYLLSKIPLLKYDAGVILAGGQHFTNLPAKAISEEQGCLLHFKYFDFFAGYVQSEVQRNQHACDSMQYRQYEQTLNNSANLIFFDQNHSVKFRDSRQLIELGVMSVDEEAEVERGSFPPVARVPNNTERPFWSIKITVYDRVEFLKRAIESVLRATADCEPAEIEVINDAAKPGIQAQIKAIIEKIGSAKVKFYVTGKNLGHPQIFNFCLDRAFGHWVHLLHDDDQVEPDFYKMLELGIKREPEIGAAFCRFAYVNEHGIERAESRLERANAGIIENWLELIATRCRVQFPAIVVNRAAYEKLGGFCTEVGSAFDWEMWKRIAASFKVWYEPKKLAYFREHAAALSHQLVSSGKQIADSRKTIAVSNSYLPVERRQYLSRTAKRKLAFFAIDHAVNQIESGNIKGAQANLREALLCSRTGAIRQAVWNLAEKYNLDVDLV